MIDLLPGVTFSLVKNMYLDPEVFSVYPNGVDFPDSSEFIFSLKRPGTAMNKRRSKHIFFL